MKVIGVRFEGKKDIDDIFSKVETYRKENEVFLQLFDPSKVIGKDHLLWAHQKAVEAFDNGENRADSIEIETLLWASAEWQIKDAIDKMGVKDDKAVIMIDGDPRDFLGSMEWERDDKILEPTEEKLMNFGIDQTEIDSVDRPFDLVFEKMSTSVL